MTGRFVKRLIYLTALGTLVCMAQPFFVVAETLKLCVDSRYWYPFTYEENSQARGIHVDIVKQALVNLGYSVQIAPVPRKRCIYLVQSGSIDGMISVAPTEELSGTLDFPPNATKTKESPWRIMQVDHMVVTHVDDPYEFENDINTLPVPVRIPRGESILEILKKAGLAIEEVSTDEQNFGKLERDKRGVIITTSVMAESMNKNPNFQGKFNIQATPLLSQSYHLVFNLNARLSYDDKQRIWNEIARLRDDYVFMLQIFAQY